MFLEPGKSYRAKTVLGTQITFTVIECIEERWAAVQLEDDGTVEPNVWLNTGLLLWISSEQKRTEAISKAADEIIESLEGTVPYKPASKLKTP
jgi:hypothetical protein